ncbi:MAG: N-acetyltransferase [Desulfobacteraceae bacterium]|nr:N-acetyltransferase [Desulfobacteraceae bacterium]
MIRSPKKTDIESIIKIWLEASIKAHDFMPSDYWESKVNDMRDVYLPSSANYVYENSGEIYGFLSIYKCTLAALFVSPSRQGEGIGSELIGFIKGKYRELTLSVYKNNTASISFYKKHGFVRYKEQIDEHTGHPEIIMKLKS